MRKILSALAVIAIASIARAAMPDTARADDSYDPSGTGGKWANVCCGGGCSYDYCTGTGSYTCCK